MTVFDKVSQAAIMKMIVEKCLRAKEENNNRMPWGFTSQLVSEYGDIFSFLSPIYIRVAVHRAEQKKKEELKKKPRCRAAKKRYVDLSLALFYCLSCVVKKVESGTCTCTYTSTYLYNYKYL